MGTAMTPAVMCPHLVPKRRRRLKPKELCLILREPVAGGQAWTRPWCWDVCPTGSPEQPGALPDLSHGASARIPHVSSNLDSERAGFMLGALL